MNDYCITQYISDNEFSTIYRAKRNSHGSMDSNLTYLIKKYNENVSEDLLNNEFTISQTIEETCPMSIVIPVLERFQTNGKWHVVMQFRKNGLFLSEIIHLLEEKYGVAKIPLEVILEITEKILASLSILHSYIYEDIEKGFLHLDLNPGNIFFESIDLEKGNYGTVKFIDFSCSVEKNSREKILKKRKWFCLSENYSAPELFNHRFSEIITSTDLYSISMCLIRLLNGPFKTQGTHQLSSLYTHNMAYSSVFNYLLGNLIECTTCTPSYYRYQSANDVKNYVIDIKNILTLLKECRYYHALEYLYKYSVPLELVADSKSKYAHKGMKDSVQCLKDSLRQDTVNYPKMLYIFKGLKSIADGILTDSRFKISLYECGITCYNYTGYTEKAMQLYEDMMQWTDHCWTVDSYLSTKIRYSVTLADCYKFEDAYKIIREVIESLEQFRTINHMNQHLIELGRAYSAAGTYASFMKYSKPLSYYQKALECFGDDLGNAIITYQKIMHYAIDINDKELYEMYLTHLIGKPIIKFVDQIKWLKTEANHTPFIMFILIKGGYHFYKNELDQHILDDIDTILRDTSLIKDNHPMQLIYKYCALMAYEVKNLEAYKTYKEKSLRTIRVGRINPNKPLNILMLITYQTNAIYCHLEKKKDKYALLRKNLKKQLHEETWKCITTFLESHDNLEHLLCHEYC